MQLCTFYLLFETSKESRSQYWKLGIIFFYINDFWIILWPYSVNITFILIFQGVFMMYLYVGSIVAIMCIYISVLIDNCPSLTNSNGSRENLTTNKGDPEVGSIASFGTLRKAHIDRTKVSRTSFYLRVGALGKKLKNIWTIPVW